jgi:A/G-specific adenine glycosylase
LICLPRNPRCGECPIRSECRGKSDPSAFPQKSAPKPWKHLREEKWVLCRENQGGHEIFLVQNQRGSWREGLWDFPAPGARGVSAGVLLSEFKLKYVVTHHRVERAHRVLHVPEGDRIPRNTGRWFALHKLPGVPAPVKKALDVVRKELSQSAPKGQ